MTSSALKTVVGFCHNVRGKYTMYRRGGRDVTQGTNLSRLYVCKKGSGGMPGKIDTKILIFPHETA